MRNDQPKYHYLRKRKANLTATFRGVVSLYLLYLGWRIASGALAGDSPIPGWAVWLLCGVFFTAAVGFGFYTWKRYRADLKTAELTQEELEEEDEP